MLKLGLLVIRVQHVLLLELHQEALIVIEENFSHDAVPFDQIDQIYDVQVPLELLHPLVHVKVISSTFGSVETFLRAADKAADA